MLNNVILMGRLVADPELKTTQSGVSVCSFRIAVDRDFKSRDGDKQTDFLEIITWRQTAEFVSKYFSKGSMIVVEGSIQTRNYEDKNGNKRTATEIVAERVHFGESKNNAQTPGTPPQAKFTASQEAHGDFTEISDDSEDLPFERGLQVPGAKKPIKR